MRSRSASPPRTRPATSRRRRAGSAAGRCRPGPGVRVDTGVRGRGPRPARLRPAHREAHGRRRRPARCDRPPGAGPGRDGRDGHPDDAAVPPLRCPRPGFLAGDLSIDWVAEEWDCRRATPSGRSRWRPRRGRRLRPPQARPHAGTRRPRRGGGSRPFCMGPRRPSSRGRAVAAMNGRVRVAPTPASALPADRADDRCVRRSRARPYVEPFGDGRVIVHGGDGSRPMGARRARGPARGWALRRRGRRRRLALRARSRGRRPGDAPGAGDAGADATAASGPLEVRAAIPGRVAAVSVAAGRRGRRRRDPPRGRGDEDAERAPGAPGRPRRAGRGRRRRHDRAGRPAGLGDRVERRRRRPRSAGARRPGRRR